MTNNLRSRRKALAIFLGSVTGAILVGAILFFTYFQVQTVEVMESGRYTEEEIKEMVLRGPMAFNSVLAPMLYSGTVEGVPFVEGFEVQQVNRSTIAISVLEKNPVGCVPFLDCYIYFDRSGRIVESSTVREEKVPYFDGLEVAQVVLDEDLSMEDESVLNTAVSLARIFEKNELIPDHILFDEQYEITLEYGDIQVNLGPDSFLEDKMARLIAILPKIRGQKGILHMESVSADIKTITFEKDALSAPKTEEGTDAQETQYGDAESSGEVRIKEDADGGGLLEGGDSPLDFESTDGKSGENDRDIDAGEDSEEGDYIEKAEVDEY